MSLKYQVLAQAKLIAGELDEKQTALLEVLCGVESDSLKARLKAGIRPEDCAAEFIAAASLYAVSAWKDADDASAVEEFKAGDMTVKKGNTGKGVSQGLRNRADQVIAPYLADAFCFAGV